jgi:uncharacterized protein
MEYRRSGGSVAIRLDEGDRVAERIREVCAKEGILSASLSGIGGCSSAEIAHFDTEKNAYATSTFSGMLELVSLIGNVTEDGAGKPALHAHASLGFPDFSVRGGHLVEATACPTCEIAVIVRDVRIRRAPNGKRGLALQRF